MRALVIAAVLLLWPAAASAAVTRPVQSVSTPTRLYWAPNALPAQVGDTIQWRMTEPGNPNAASHDIWVIRPGADPSTATQIGATFLNGGIADQVVDTAGTWTFYCNIHGGLAPGGMNGTVTVGADDPGPAVDPGQPWTQPDTGGGGSGIETGPAPLLNATAAPTLFESGDNVAPTMSVRRVKVKHRVARVSVKVSEPGELYLRVLRGRKTVRTRHVDIKAGRSSASVTLPKRHAKYRLAVWAQDAGGLESKWRYQTLRL